MKKSIRICSTLVGICCLVCLLVSCGNNHCIQYGNYYLTSHEDSYIVLSDETILFHNVDFSDIEKQIWDYFGESFDVAEILAGEKCYDTNKTFDKIYIQISDIIYLTLRYDGSKKSLSMIGQKFVLQQAEYF